MDDVFYIDVKDGVNISYHQLIEDVRNTFTILIVKRKVIMRCLRI